MYTLSDESVQLVLDFFFFFLSLLFSSFTLFLNHRCPISKMQKRSFFCFFLSSTFMFLLSSSFQCLSHLTLHSSLHSPSSFSRVPPFVRSLPLIDRFDSLVVSCRVVSSVLRPVRPSSSCEMRERGEETRVKRYGEKKATREKQANS